MASFGVSLVALTVAALKDLYLDRARLKVTAGNFTLYSEADPLDFVMVSATNIGRRDTYLQSLWLQVGWYPRWWSRFIPKDWRRYGGKGALIIPPANELNSPVPATLPVGATASAFYPWELVVQRMSEQTRNEAWGSAEATTSRGRSKRFRPAETTKPNAKGEQVGTP